MIPFEEISERLEKLKKSRLWLSQESGRPFNSIRTALAPGAPKSKRSTLLQKALSDAIEREEAAQKQPPAEPSLPDRITLLVEPEKRLRYEAAAADSDHKHFTPWAIAELDKAAEEWAAAKAHEERGGTYPARFTDGKAAARQSPGAFLNEETARKAK